MQFQNGFQLDITPENRADFVMAGGMLRGIKQRAERLAREGDAQLATPATTID